MPANDALLITAETGFTAKPSAPIRSEVPTEFKKTLPGTVEAVALMLSVTEATSATAIGASSTMAIRRNLAGPVLVSMPTPSIMETVKLSLTAPGELGALVKV